jgi:type I restriction enzyme M protein
MKEKPKRYKIFMAIAEHIGYDATGKTDPKNDLNAIYKEYEKFKS